MNNFMASGDLSLYDLPLLYFSLRHHQGRSGPLAKRLTRNKPIQIIWSNLLHTAHTLIHRTRYSTTFNEGAWGGCWEGDNDGNGRRMQSGLVARQGSCSSTRRRGGGGGKVAAQAQGATGSIQSTWRWFVQVKAGLQRTRGESKPPTYLHLPTTHFFHLNLALSINHQTFPCFSPKLIIAYCALKPI